MQKQKSSWKRILAALLICTMLASCLVFQADALSTSQQNFLTKIGAMAVQDMKDTGILASLTIAQAILESGWGTSTLTVRGNNLFGIKAYPSGWTGKVYCRKNAVIYDNFTAAKSALGATYSSCYEDFFRVYDSWAGSLADHSRLFNTASRYENLRGETDYVTACKNVQADGYCDGDYAEYLIKLIETYDLNQYDLQNTTPTEVSSVALDITSPYTMILGTTYTLTSYIYPTSAADKALTFTSSAPSVISVTSSGKLTALAVGSAVITAASANGVKASVTVYAARTGDVTYNAVTTGAVNCRTEPSTSAGSATIVGTFAAGAVLQVYGEKTSGGWYYVSGTSAAGKKILGYTYATYIELTGVVDNGKDESSEPETSGGSSLSGSTEGKRYQLATIINSDLTVHSTPDNLSSSAIAYFSKNATVVLIGDPTDTGIYLAVGIAQGNFRVEGYIGGVDRYIRIDGELLTIDGKALTVDENSGCLTGIPERTTLSTLRSAQGSNVQITASDANGKALADNAVLGTAAKIKVSVAGFDVCELSIAVRGDTDGDGSVSTTDYIRLRRVLLGEFALSGAYEAAADTDGNGKFDSKDYVFLRQYLLGTVTFTK